jgi:hypothetical protein
MADNPAIIPSPFSKFNSLPREIRDMIWEAALPPRIVHIEAQDRKLYPCFRVRSDIAIDALNQRGVPTFFYDYQCSDERPDHSLRLSSKGSIIPGTTGSVSLPVLLKSASILRKIFCF